ncbi:peptidase S16 lon domain protein [Ferrimonas balearica DSM 9799]|uniref:Peptidase S16 lon domain protein n=1 Tax=Ferrimonas balearica (strain DSM 9799 / CCM 4581 / KCTC 23876 / PAT) TaxID=550540 RepID=E1SP42_FERBD|nr:LON peptidase substrate-binding domain-containing protein [Ferrimonas balearica]ADN74691.1 peptidase S16 lon domain protein [Ferrimonas balearica DSM 9799]MBW3140482.1 LON peptidase substrate-binding domain-containing protein [Ferrimonas balearica]MBW3165530.1 LON peptidase substrate-binding domain-containing protein [Ferrimonas balearica]MBY5981256.1 LON peptidase substrate-binding domain-containing protein [Ferrimonas balearica]MBY6107708.1 LON peptidase substrate-binding domain-containin
MKRIEAALLPIDDPVLPEGRKELRIVTPGQLRMVAASLKDGSSLAVCMSREEGDMPCYPIATLVDVVDFFQLDDDTLSVVVEGRQRVRVLNTWAAPDGVWMGETLTMTNWPSFPLDNNFSVLGEALRRLYEAQPELGHLYHDPHLEDASWVSQRWLEVLPLVEQEKQRLMGQPDCGKTMQYVLSLILSHQ